MTEDVPKDLAKLSPKERAHLTYMMDVGRRIEWDLHNAIDRGGFIPADWHRIARATPERKRVKITMRVEEDVLRFFRATGEGYLPRMAEVLKVYMHARLAGLVRGAETINHYRVREESHAGDRPAFGTTAAARGEPWEDLPAPAGAGPTSSERIAEFRYQQKLRDRAEAEAATAKKEREKAKRALVRAVKERVDGR